MALIKSRSGIFARTFHLGLLFGTSLVRLFARSLARQRYLRLGSQPSSRDLLESAPFILGPCRVAPFSNAPRRQSDIQRNRLNLVFTSEATNLHSFARASSVYAGVKRVGGKEPPLARFPSAGKIEKTREKGTPARQGLCY